MARIPWECFCYLARDPFCGRICGDVDPDEVSAVQLNDDEAIEQVEANGRGNEQVHGGNVRRVVTQKGAPSLPGRAASLDHVLGDARLRDLKPKLESSRGAPQSGLSMLIRRINTRCLDLRP